MGTQVQTRYLKKACVSERTADSTSGLGTYVLTILPIEADLSLVLLLSLQGFVHLLDHALAGLGPVEEAAGASFLHHLSPGEAGQLAEAVGAVHDRVATATLSVSQQEVTI